MLPVSTAVKAPAGFPDLSTIKLMPIPIADILRSDEKDKERFADLFGR
jgi:hypothetical protein